MSKILTFKTHPKAAVPSTPETTALNKRRLEGLAFIEETNKAVDRVGDHEKMQRYEADKITFAMRRALDFIPTSLLRELADEVATEYELRR